MAGIRIVIEFGIFGGGARILATVSTEPNDNKNYYYVSEKGIVIRINRATVFPYTK